MRLIYSFLFFNFLLFIPSIFSQNECEVSSAIEALDINDMVVGLPVEGDFWWDRSDYLLNLFTDTSGSPNPYVNLVGSLWVAGKVDDEIRVSAQTFGAANNNSAFFAGPIDLASGGTSISQCENFGRHWKVNRNAVEAHIIDFENNGQIDGPVPESILEWPGQGNPESETNNGFPLPEQPLAPFIDRNENGIYEPLFGDYPEMKGDQLIWWVFNDVGNTVPTDEDLGIEVHATAFAFDKNENPELDKTTFYEFKLINRSGKNWEDAYTSFWIDGTTGCSFESQFIGCDSTEKIAYLYTQEAGLFSPDCTCPFSNIPGCFDFPLTGLKVLKGPLNDEGEDVGFSSFMYINNAGIGSPSPATTDPETPSEFYNYMQSKWRDGTPLIRGGDGYGEGPFTNFAFSSSPNSTVAGSWSMCTEMIPQFNRRILINSGPFDLAAGEETSITYALIAAIGEDYPCPDISSLLEVGQAAQLACDDIINSSGEVSFSRTQLDLFPNPLSNQTKLFLKNTDASLLGVEIYSMDGKAMRRYHQLSGNELIIERGGLPDGVYFLKILLSNGQWAVEKMVVH